MLIVILEFVRFKKKKSFRNCYLIFQLNVLQCKCNVGDEYYTIRNVCMKKEMCVRWKTEFSLLHAHCLHACSYRTNCSSTIDFDPQFVVSLFHIAVDLWVVKCLTEIFKCCIVRDDEHFKHCLIDSYELYYEFCSYRTAVEKYQ